MDSTNVANLVTKGNAPHVTKNPCNYVIVKNTKNYVIALSPNGSVRKNVGKSCSVGSTCVRSFAMKLGKNAHPAHLAKPDIAHVGRTPTNWHVLWPHPHVGILVGNYWIVEGINVQINAIVGLVDHAYR